jgi:hypothetical protein
VPALPQVKDGIMADLAVVVIFAQMKLMAEHNRVSVFEGKFDILGFGCTGANSTEHYNCIDKQNKVFPHGFHSSGL